MAERLHELDVPFAFASGYGDSYALPANLGAYPIIEKPYTKDMLRATLAGIIPS